MYQNLLRKLLLLMTNVQGISGISRFHHATGPGDIGNLFSENLPGC